MRKPTILIVEDDRELGAMIAEYLEEQGFAIDLEDRGDRAVSRVLVTKPDVVILDLMLPGKDGRGICREVRSAYDGSILMLTAHGGEADEVVCLDVGADDYLSKPVRPRVLLARVHALLRRRTVALGAMGTCLRVGELTVDPTLREARVCGEPIRLTSGELDLLLLFASHAGKVVDRKTMYQRLRGTENDELDRSVDLMVSRLRHKLTHASGRPDPIKTVRGVGYLLCAS